MTLLTVENLTLQFKTDEGLITCVNDVSFEVNAGEVLGVVGESGSGKSITAKSIMHLNSRNAVYGRQSKIKLKIDKREVNVFALQNDRDLKVVRGGAVSMIFQEPMASFAPAITIGDQMVEQLLLHKNLTKSQAVNLSIEMLERVGISDAPSRFKQYAFELSGGMRQRAMIAMALSTSPKLLIADEPTTALDVTIQAQILDLMRTLRDELGTAILLITHDLGVVAEMCDSVAVMYAGRIVEYTDVDTLFNEPLHPYTEGLLNSIPVLGQVKDELAVIQGTVPNLIGLPEEVCHFAPRCGYQAGHEICLTKKPPLYQLREGHSVRCWRFVPETQGEWEDHPERITTGAR
jgi:oligopeptide/dipeptide ABC transporter ATP-binding protein